MDTNAKAAGKMAALPDNEKSSKAPTVKNNSQRVAMRTTYDIQLILNKLHQANS